MASPSLLHKTISVLDLKASREIHLKIALFLLARFKNVHEGFKIVIFSRDRKITKFTKSIGQFDHLGILANFRRYFFSFFFSAKSDVLIISHESTVTRKIAAPKNHFRLDLIGLLRFNDLTDQ